MNNSLKDCKISVRKIGRIFLIFFHWRLKPSCCKNRQKSPNQETGLGNRVYLKVLKENQYLWFWKKKRKIYFTIIQCSVNSICPKLNTKFIHNWTLIFQSKKVLYTNFKNQFKVWCRSGRKFIIWSLIFRPMAATTKIFAAPKNCHNLAFSL